MAYTVAAPTTWGDSTRQWQVTKGADADDTFSITHNLSVAPLFLPTINPFSASQADITAYKNAMASVESISATVINGRMSTAVGSGGAKALYTSLFPLK